jgi:hypothetical protein
MLPNDVAHDKVCLLDQGMRRLIAYHQGSSWDLVWCLLLQFRNVTLDEAGCFLLASFF